MQKHVYFDLDGTLTDPYVGISRCFLYALDQLGFEHPPPEFLLSCIGPPLYDTFPEIVGDDLTHQAINHYRKRFDDVGWQENVPYDGIHDALQEVANSGATLYVATSKPHVAARRIIEYFGFGDFFNEIYGCELDGTRSNKVDLLRYAIGENPTAKCRVMIGDRKHDLIGATANDMRPIGVAYGYGSEVELKTAGAIAIAAQPSELPPIISSL